MNPPESNAAYGQQYNLKWTNHTNNILQMFSEQLLKESLVDVTLSCEGQFIKAHKMVLSACSPYFQDLFKIHTVDHPLIIMNGVRFVTVKQMIDFMYQGEIKVGDADLDHLLTIAENLQIKGLCKIRREKNVTDSAPLMSDILKMQNTNAQNANVNTSGPAILRGRKRRKQSHSPSNMNAQGASAESQLNGDVSSNELQQTTVTAEKLPALEDVVKEESDKDLPKSEPKLSKLAARQSLPSMMEVSYEDKTVDKQGSKIPRPPNAFMIFANEWRKKLATEHQGESNKEISVRLGNMWKSLPGPTKDWYYTAARKADEDHKVKYPGYYYSPKEARLRKEMRGNSQKPSNIATGGTSKSIDSLSLLKAVAADAKNDGSNAEESPPADDIKEEPEDFDIFGDGNDSSNSSVENLPSASSTKE